MNLKILSSAVKIQLPTILNTYHFAPFLPGFQTMLNPTHIYTVKKGCENRIFGFPQKYHVKTTQDSTQMTFGCQI